jgi:hypothetical protein
VFILRYLSFLLLSILATIFAVSVMKLTVRLSLHFIPLVSFYNTITVTQCHCLFHICYRSVLSLFSDRFHLFTLQNLRANFFCISLVFSFEFWFSGPLD